MIGVYLRVVNLGDKMEEFQLILPFQDGEFIDIIESFIVLLTPDMINQLDAVNLISHVGDEQDVLNSPDDKRNFMNALINKQDLNTPRLDKQALADSLVHKQEFYNDLKFSDSEQFLMQDKEKDDPLFNDISAVDISQNKKQSVSLFKNLNECKEDDFTALIPERANESEPLELVKAKQTCSHQGCRSDFKTRKALKAGNIILKQFLALKHDNLTYIFSYF